MPEVKATGSGALSYTFSEGIACKVTEIELHLNAVGGAAESFTATKDDATGATYDVNYITQDMNTKQDLVNTDQHKLEAKDKIVFAWANSGGKTWGLTVKYERINELP